MVAIAPSAPRLRLGDRELHAADATRKYLALLEDEFGPSWAQSPASLSLAHRCIVSRPHQNEPGGDSSDKAR